MNERTVTLSVVAPVYNEAAVIDELITRTLAALDEVGVPSEFIVVDDASDDETHAKLDANATRDARVKPLILAQNAGQFVATLRGMAKAKGDWVVVLDGDLQDPPEHIVSLWQARLEQRCDVVFATKNARTEVWWFGVGQRVYHRLQRVFGSGSSPPHAGSYCLLSRRVASRVQQVTSHHLNLSVAVSLISPLAWSQVPYRKEARFEGTSRVGFSGLCREAVHSLAATGALHRVAFLLSLGLCLGAMWLWSTQMPILAGLSGCLALVAFGFGLAARRFRRRTAAAAIGPRPGPERGARG